MLYNLALPNVENPETLAPSAVEYPNVLIPLKFTDLPVNSVIVPIETTAVWLLKLTNEPTPLPTTSPLA